MLDDLKWKNIDYVILLQDFTGIANVRSRSKSVPSFGLEFMPESLV